MTSNCGTVPAMRLVVSNVWPYAGVGAVQA